MGQAQTALLPWQTENCQVDLPQKAQEEILHLSESSDAFLKAGEVEVTFDFEENGDRVQSALLFDARLGNWLPKLVPKHVSEHDFWSHYFSHMQAIVSRASAELPENAGGEDEKEEEGEECSDVNALEPPQVLCFEGEELGDPIRWGIVGAGRVCEIKSGPALLKGRGSTVMAVCRRTEAAALDFAKRHNIPKVYTNVDELLEDSEVDAVYIATPPSSHMEIALKVAKAQKPCFVEKPMARSWEECRKMLHAFHKAKQPLFVAYYRRGHERWLQARQIVAKVLGEVTSVQYTLHRNDHLVRTPQEMGWRVDCGESGGGLFVDLGSHVLDIFDFLFGPLSHVTGDARNLAANQDLLVETCVAMTFRTAAGATGSAQFNFCSANFCDELVVCGTKGKLTMSVFSKDPPVFTPARGEAVEYAHVYPEFTHLPLVEATCLCLRGGNVAEDRLSTGDSAARTAQVVDSVLRQFYRSRTDDFWKRPRTWDNNRQAGLAFQSGMFRYS